jgi:hypothetical protein
MTLKNGIACGSRGWNAVGAAGFGNPQSHHEKEDDRTKRD